MPRLDSKEITRYIESNIGDFHSKRIEKLKKLELFEILKRKNPYLFRAKNILTSEALIKSILDAHLSSQEETLFGEFLEGLAIFINAMVFDGKKSAAEGIDLEFQRDNVVYLVTVKSGPHWGNSSQIKRMEDNFRKAKKILKTNAGSKNIVAVNGCCYGKERSTDKGDYLKLCGQSFWEFISGEKNLYIDIIEPLGHRAKEKNDEFNESYAAVINEFSMEFMKEFCESGRIQWDKLLKFNSSAD